MHGRRVCVVKGRMIVSHLERAESAPSGGTVGEREAADCTRYNLSWGEREETVVSGRQGKVGQDAAMGAGWVLREILVKSLGVTV